MSSTHSRQSGAISSSDTLEDHTDASSIPTSEEFVEIPPNHSNEGVIRQIEELFQSMIESIVNSVELSITYRTGKNRTSHDTIPVEIPTHRYWTRSKNTSQSTTQSRNQTQTQRDLLMFPAQNLQKQKRFGEIALPGSLGHSKITDFAPVSLFRILEIVHDALHSGNLVTKRFEQESQVPSLLFKNPDTNRSIYYQNIELFSSQATVDNMVDNLAFTLGVGRGDLNIACFNQIHKSS